jgi:hypothetical protein
MEVGHILKNHCPGTGIQHASVWEEGRVKGDNSPYSWVARNWDEKNEGGRKLRRTQYGK